MSDRGGCIVCGVVMGGEADPLRCHDCVVHGSWQGTPLDGLTVERLARALRDTEDEWERGDFPTASTQAALVLAALREGETKWARLVEIEEAARNAVSNAFSAKTMNALAAALRDEGETT